MITRRTWARTAGAALLAIILFGFAGMALQAAGDGPDHQTAFRAGLACEFLMLNNDVLLAAALFGLLRAVDPTLALLGAFWRFANAVVLAVGLVAAVTSMRVFDATGQAVGLSQAFAHMHGAASPIGLWFWSLGAAVHSWLLLKSGCIPRLLSGLYLAVAVVIFFGCAAEMLSPAVTAIIDPWFVLPDLPVELAVGLWLAVQGAAVDGDAHGRAEVAP